MIDIKGYEGLYSVTEKGEVISHSRIINAGYGSKRTIKGGILKQKIDSRGYPTVTLYNGGKHNFKHHRVHRLIMEHYRPVESMILLDVNHKDGNKINNAIDNLEWASRSQNIQHAHDTGLNKSRNSQKQKAAASKTFIKRRKLTFAQAQEVRKLYSNGKNQRQISEIYKVNRATIGLIINNKTYIIEGSIYNV